jgi:hypothetical protein
MSGSEAPIMNFILGIVAFVFVVLLAGYIGGLSGLLLLVFAIANYIADAASLHMFYSASGDEAR